MLFVMLIIFGFVRGFCSIICKVVLFVDSVVFIKYVVRISGIWSWIIICCFSLVVVLDSFVMLIIFIIFMMSDKSIVIIIKVMVVCLVFVIVNMGF